MQLAPTMMGLTSVLARMDFLVTGKLAKVGKVVSQINFFMKIWPGFGFFCDTKRTFFIASCKEIRNPGLWNPEYSSRNPEAHWRLEFRIQIPLTKTGIQYLKSGIHGVESRIQDCLGIPYMERFRSSKILSFNGRICVCTPWITSTIRSL